jgi:hypothetical protein
MTAQRKARRANPTRLRTPPERRYFVNGGKPNLQRKAESSIQ